MGDPNADKGSQDNIVATATLCVVSELKPFTQYSFNMTVFTLDSIGREVTNLSLQFTLFTKATGKKITDVDCSDIDPMF